MFLCLNKKKKKSPLCKVCLICPYPVFNEMWNDLLVWSQTHTMGIFICVCVLAHLSTYAYMSVLVRPDMKNICFQACPCLIYWGILQPISVSTYDISCSLWIWASSLFGLPFLELEIYVFHYEPLVFLKVCANWGWNCKKC